MARPETDEKKLDWNMILVLLTLLSMVVAVTMAWASFATTQYVDTKVQATDAKIEAVKKDENLHYIELLKTVNEVKVLLENKQNRKDGGN